MEAREEGGNNDFVWQLPTKLKYSNVKLTRPLGRDTEKVARWFASMATGFTRKTATVQAMRADGKPVASWSLYGVVPVRWSGPSLTADSPKVVMETVEIAHQGFVATGAGA
jgi:phage tail-like protein